MRKFFAILLMYNMFFVTGSGGQNIDSLKTKPGNLTSSERGRILFDKGNAYLKSGELDSCVFYTRKAVKFLEYDSDLSNAYENLGMCFYYKNDFAEALENFKISAAYAEDAGNDSIIARRYSDLGVVYDYLGAYDKATENYLKAVKIFEKNKDYYGISKISNNLGVINETLGKYDMALSYYNKSLELKQKVGANPEESASTYVNIGSVSEKRGDTEGALSQYKKALDIYEKSGNVRYAALCLNNTANIYYEKNKLESAEKYVRKALNLSGKFPESGIRGKSYLILSNIFISRSDYDKALQYLKKASEIAEKRELTELKKDISESEIKISESAGDYKKAFLLQKKLTILKDSLHKKNIKEKSEKMQIVYETDKKEQKIKQLSREVKQKRMLWIISVFVLLLILAVVYLFLRNKLNKSKLRNYEFKQKLLRSQMNPHFIFNALNSVQAFMLENNTDEAAVYLSAFSKLSRSVLENSRKEFITVREETETSDNYLKIQQLRMPGLFDYDIIIDENLDEDFYLIPPMLTQPFIENAVLHAFNDIDYKGKIEVEFLKTDNSLKISVRDNGTGYRKKNSGKSRLHATEITYERLKILRKQSKTNIDFKIVNLSDISGKTGTEVVFTLPLIKNISDV